MKWLLLTGFDNPGDEWARMGVVKLIRAVDKKAELFPVDKLCHYLDDTTDCDRIVFCGQPFVWAHSSHNTTMAPWWHGLSTWMLESGKLILGGYGIFLNHDNEGKPIVVGGDDVLNPIRSVVEKCRAAYCRNPLAKDLLSHSAVVQPCPSIFAGSHLTNVRNIKLCNFMDGGGHYRHKDESRAAQWDAIEYRIAMILQKAGFVFAAHVPCERSLAMDRFGWDENQIITYDNSPEDFLNHYSRCVAYFGNRVHGAIVSRSFGADSWLVGLDTRMRAAELVGAKVSFPGEIDVDEVEAWANGGHSLSIPHLSSLFKDQVMQYAV